MLVAWVRSQREEIGIGVDRRKISIAFCERIFQFGKSFLQIATAGMDRTQNNQDDLGLPATSVRNAHMDTLQGRLWLQLEVQALSKACAAEADQRSGFERDALLFRAVRQAKFPGAK